jgi:hypothetical protein
MSKSEEIIAKLNGLTQFIEEALTKLQNGEVVDLSHLDAKVAQLCEETLKLPPEEAVKVQPVMGDMISKLETLGLALQDFQKSLKDQN